MRANNDRVFWVYYYDGDGGRQTWSTEATLIEALASALDCWTNDEHDQRLSLWIQGFPSGCVFDGIAEVKAVEDAVYARSPRAVALAKPAPDNV